MSRVPTMLAVILAVLTAAPAVLGQDAEPKNVADLVARMKARGETVQSATMRMTARGAYPDGVTFEIQGSIRVLGTTHFHLVTRATFEAEVSSESETVKTPAGVWMREKDPAHGEVFLKMDKDLVAQLDQAEKVLAEGPQAPGTMDNPAKDPMGSEMLSTLSQQFELQLSPRVIEGRDYFVVDGPVRGDAPGIGDPELPLPDRVELLVRRPDLAIVRMTQFRAGAELMQMQITDLELDRPLDQASFRLDLPAGSRWIDVMDHPPAAAKIRDTLERAKDKQAEQPADKAEPGAGRGK